MKRDILLIVMLSLLIAITGGCNGVALDTPNSNPLPGSGADNPVPVDKIEGNYAIDILPEREIPTSIPVDNPDWRPTFGCLTDNPTCINEGCIEFKVKNLDLENLKVEFNATFYNWNAENFNALTVFLVITDTSLGVTLDKPDGKMKLNEKDTIEFPYYAFSNDNNPGDNDVPGTMYCFFERNITFNLTYGCDFYVNYILVPIIDQHDLSYKIDLPGRTTDPNIGGGGDGEGDDDREGAQGPGPANTAPVGQSGSDDGSEDNLNTHPITPPISKPGS